MPPGRTGRIGRNARCSQIRRDDGEISRMILAYQAHIWRTASDENEYWVLTIARAKVDYLGVEGDPRRFM